MNTVRRWTAAALLASIAHPAWAPDLLSAVYDPRTDAILVEVAYLGTRPDHDFTVHWGKCIDGGVAARLVDEQGSEVARVPYRVVRRVRLDRLPCRPATVTLRLGRIAHFSVRVPGQALR